jgi:tRNA modification GTPase
MAHTALRWLWKNEQATTPVDQALILLFNAPHSFTGEDVAEIQCHGGHYLPQTVLELCLAAGATPATAGEFTLRAFLNGKLSLTQAESVLDMIHAQSQQLAQLAASNLKSQTLQRYLGTVRAQLYTLQAQVVAATDYPDEVDEPERAPLLATLEALSQQAQAFSQASQASQQVRQGLQVALVGLPNAGKSSLFNALLAEDRSIVTPLAGTTRDLVSERLALAGVALTLVDTAGLRETEDTVESLGVARSQQAALAADVGLQVMEAAHWLAAEGTLLTAWPAEEAAVWQRLAAQPARALVLSKIDQLPHGLWPSLQAHVQGLVQATVLGVASPTGEGVADVRAWLGHSVQQHTALLHRQGQEFCLNQRQSACLVRMSEHIEVARHTLATTAYPLDLVTVPLSDALRELDTLLGIDTTEAVLDEVFSSFCVGK